MQSKLTEEQKDMVAFYHVVGTLGKNIADRFGVASTTVSRIIKDYKKKEFIYEKLILNLPQSRTDRLHSQMSNTELERRIYEAYRLNRLNRIIVVNLEPETDISDIKHKVVFEAARILETVLTQGRQVIGVTWGRTLRQVVEEVDPKRANPQLEFIPLRGGIQLPADDKDFRLSMRCQSNVIAERFAEKFGGTFFPLNVPAYIPRVFEDGREHELNAIWEFVQLDWGYKMIFGDRDTQPNGTLINQVSTVVTGIGMVHERWCYWIRWLHTHLTQEEKDDLIHGKTHVIGDLASLFLSRKVGDEFARRKNDRIIGISLADFEDIAWRYDNAKGKERKGTGVTLISVGDHKAEAIYHCLEHKLINTLIIDSKSACEILRIRELVV